MEETPPRDRFLASLDRCRASERFFGDFYERFVGSSDAVAAKFRGVDMTRQREMLEGSLRLAAAATAGEAAGLRELRERATTHDRDHHDIAPEMYELWRDALIATAAESDPVWNDPIADAWRRVLDPLIAHMQKHY